MSSQPPARLGKRARHQLSFPYSSTALPPPSFPAHPGSSTSVYSRLEGLLTAENYTYRSTRLVPTGKKLKKKTNHWQYRRQVISIDVLPVEVLLEVFGVYVDEDRFTRKGIEAWQSLVHVCQRWRAVVFGSLRRLNLRLVCTSRTPALNVWPALPLLIWDRARRADGLLGNITTLLEQSNRACEIDLGYLTSLQLGNVSAAMQEPFPELTHLELRSCDEMVPVLPDSFLGGSAPRLRFLRLDGIPFPGLPKLLLSTTHLSHLYLRGIPHSGYFSPELIFTALSPLTSLRSLLLGFHSPRSHPDWASRRPPPPTRCVLPVLASFTFKGVSEYLDALVAHIHAPRLHDFSITFFNQIVFDTPQLVQFINRTPTLNTLEKACIVFGNGATSVRLSSDAPNYRELNVKILCKELDWQVSSLEQFFVSCSPPLSTLKLLVIEGRWQSHWQDNIESTLWLELLHPFFSVTTLSIAEGFARHIALALQELVAGGRSTEALPALQYIFLSGPSGRSPFPKGLQAFVAARQVTSHPVVALC